MLHKIQNYQPGRLISLDVYRGMVMIFLIAESAAVYTAWRDLTQDTWGAALVRQFFHHPWNGLRFWDLIQPFFMFIVGVAMPFSLKKRLQAADGTRGEVWPHIVRRCLWLFLFGIGLHCFYQQRLVWELWNVLTQLSFTILVAFLLIRMPLSKQVFVTAMLLVITEIAYRAYHPADPYSREDNFGMWMDLLLMGKVNNDGWVAINCIPTAAHTIWGVVCGKLLLSERHNVSKIQFLLIMGGVLLIAGYTLAYTYTPLIKRIATSSFVLVSGGYAVLALAVFYWLIDIRKWRSGAWICIVVGANSIFIYLFAQLAGSGLNQWVNIFTSGFSGIAGLSGMVIGLVNGLVTVFIMWYICYFFYRKELFFKV